MSEYLVPEIEKEVDIIKDGKINELTDEQFLEFQNWVKNTWTEREQSKFFSLLMDYSRKGMTPEVEEKYKDVREIVVKKYDEFATEFANDYIKSEEMLEKSKAEIRMLEEKLGNKENYLITIYPARIKGINLDNDISSVNAQIKELEQEKNKIIQDRENEFASLKERQELAKATFELARQELAIVNHTEERYQQLWQDYHALAKDIEELQNQIDNFDHTKGNERISEIDAKLDIYNRKLDILQRQKLENDEILSGKPVYDTNAIRLDEDRLQKLRVGVEATETRLKETGNTDYVEIFDHQFGSKEKTQEPTPEPKRKRREVVKQSVWEWVKDHKKQILIALGLTALTISLVVLITQLIPAIMAAQQASTAAGILAQMTSNGTAWFGANAAEQVALHSANTALAGQLSAVTGVGTSYATGAGLWTIGGQTLSAATVAAQAAAAKATATVAALKGTTLLAGIGSIGFLGTGLSLNKRSTLYKEINERIKNLKEKYETMSFEEFVAESNSIENSLLHSSEKEISKSELNSLYKKLQSILRKGKTYHQAQTDKELEDLDNSYEEVSHGDMDYGFSENDLEYNIGENVQEDPFIDDAVEENDYSSSLDSNTTSIIDEYDATELTEAVADNLEFEEELEEKGMRL